MQSFHLCHVSCLIKWMLIFEAGSFTQTLWLPRNEKEAEAKYENMHLPFCSQSEALGKYLMGRAYHLTRTVNKYQLIRTAYPYQLKGRVYQLLPSI